LQPSEARIRVYHEPENSAVAGSAFYLGSFSVRHHDFTRLRAARPIAYAFPHYAATVCTRFASVN
jgi:hypothetical protein